MISSAIIQVADENQLNPCLGKALALHLVQRSACNDGLMFMTRTSVSVYQCKVLVQ